MNLVITVGIVEPTQLTQGDLEEVIKDTLRQFLKRDEGRAVQFEDRNLGVKVEVRLAL